MTTATIALVAAIALLVSESTAYTLYSNNAAPKMWPVDATATQSADNSWLTPRVTVKYQFARTFGMYSTAHECDLCRQLK